MREVYTVLDFETTGLDPEKNQVIEIGAVKTDLIREFGRLSFPVKLDKGRDLPPFITNLTGITEDDLVCGLTKSQAALVLKDFLGLTTIVAHHAKFDLGFLTKDLGLSYSNFICTRHLAKLLYPSESRSLADVCSKLNVDLKFHHRAINDALATKEILKKMIVIADNERLKYRNTFCER